MRRYGLTPRGNLQVKRLVRLGSVLSVTGVPPGLLQTARSLIVANVRYSPHTLRPC